MSGESIAEGCLDCGCPLEVCCGERLRAELKKAIDEEERLSHLLTLKHLSKLEEREFDKMYGKGFAVIGKFIFETVIFENLKKRLNLERVAVEK